MLLMNGYLRKAQHDENNLNIEVTVEVISDFKVKKASVFNGFKRQTTKSTASRLPVARRSSASAESFNSASCRPSGRQLFLLPFSSFEQGGTRDFSWSSLASKARPAGSRRALSSICTAHTVRSTTPENTNQPRASRHAPVRSSRSCQSIWRVYRGAKA